MSKAILVMDMPKSCGDCCFSAQRYNFCTLLRKSEINYSHRTDWCPLKEVPEKKEVLNPSKRCETWEMNCTEYERGYNACIDEILGGGE